jgi:hypothetical protein
LWVVFGETRFPLPDTATMNRLYPNRFAYRVASGAPGGALRSVPADGTLLREESGRISVVFGSAKFAVPDMATFDRLFPGGSTFQVADGSLADIPDAPVDGTLLREENGRISAVVGRARFAIPDEPTLTRLFGGRPVFQLWDDAPSGIPEVPIDGTLLREESGAISVVLGGARLGVPDVGTFQRLFGARPTFPLWDGALDSIPTTPRDGTVLREESGALWVIAGQSRLPIPDAATYGRLYPTRPVLQVWDGALSGISGVPLDGTLLSDESGRVFVVIGGAKFAVPGQVTRERLFPGQPLHPVWNGFLDRLPNVPADGTLLREDNGRTWVVYAQARFQVPDPRTLQRLFPGQTVHQVWDGALDAISRIPADGALLREESGRISVVYAGARFAVPDPRTFQRFFAGRPVFQVWDGALAQVPDVPGSGTLLREESGRIWVVHAGAKFAVPDWPTFQRLFAGRPVFQLWDGAPKQIPDIPADGTLLREENGAIWVVYGGARFHVPDPVTLQRLFPGVPIFQLWDGALDRLGNIPSDGTCLGEEDEPSEVYDIFGGCRQPAIPLILIDPWGRIQFKYPSCRRLWDQSLSHIPPCS